MQAESIQNTVVIELPADATLKKARLFTEYGNRYAANTELFRYLHYRNVSGDEYAGINYLISENFYRQKKHPQAEEYLDRAVAAAGSPALTKALAFRRLRLQAQTATDIWPLIRAYGNNYASLMSIREREQLRFWAVSEMIARGDTQTASVLLREPAAYDQFENYRMSLQKRLQQPPGRISGYNMLYSLFPGGYFFSREKFSRGLISFLTVGSLSALSVFSYRAGADLTALVSGFFSLRYYLDSINRSFIALNSENRRRLNEYYHEISEKPDFINPGYLITFQYRY